MGSTKPEVIQYDLKVSNLLNFIYKYQYKITRNPIIVNILEIFTSVMFGSMNIYISERYPGDDLALI